MVFTTEKSFRLLSLHGPGTEFINPIAQGDSALWRLVLIGPDKANPAFLPANGIYEGVDILDDTPDVVRFCLKWCLRPAKTLKMPVRVIVEARRDSGLSYWHFETDLPNGWSVQQVDFPRFIHLDANMPKARLLVPSGWGLMYEYLPGYVFEGAYPSCLQGMQMFGLESESNDFLYVAAHDKFACLKTFRASVGQRYGEMRIETPASVAWSQTADGHFVLPWTVAIGIHDGGWQAAALDWYRPFSYETVWGSRKLDLSKYPQWLLNADLWLRPDFATEEMRRDLNRGLDYFGTEVGLHWYRWHQIEYDTHYPDYFPPLTDFPPMVREARERGTHVVPYINGRLWDPVSDSWSADGGAQWAARKFDGTLYCEVYGSMVANAVACPSTAVWRGKISGLVKRLHDEIGVDGVYIDQICAAPGVPCWSESHEHPAGGGDWWHQAYRKLIGQVRAEQDKPVVLTTEENAECFMDLFDFLLLVNTPQDGSQPVPLWSLIYADRCVMFGFQYYHASEPKNVLSFRVKNTLALLWGSQLGWINPTQILQSGCESEAAFLRDLAQFRRGLHDLIYGGRFLGEVSAVGDNPVIEGNYTGPFDGIIYPLQTLAVRGALWQSAEGKRGVLLVNLDAADHDVDLPDELGGGRFHIAAGQGLRIELKDK